MAKLKDVLKTLSAKDDYQTRTIKNQLNGILAIRWTAFGLFLLLFIIFLFMAIGPKYRVWKQEMRGKAAFAEAEQNRRIVVEEAAARYDAELLNAKSEVERAKGMAEAMEIENGQLTEVYNQYLFIRSLEAIAQYGDLPQIIYLPSKGLLPVMDLKVPGTPKTTE